MADSDLLKKLVDGESSKKKKKQTLDKQKNEVFLVHPSDSPTAVLVSHLLTGDNYGTWVRSMRWLYGRRTDLILLKGLYLKQVMMMVVNGNAVITMLDLGC